MGKILLGVPLGCILGPHLFKKFIYDMFCFTVYTHDNTSFGVRENRTSVIKALEDIGEGFIKWFSDNQTKLNTDKCHILLNSQGSNTIKIGNLFMHKKLFMQKYVRYKF